MRTRADKKKRPPTPVCAPITLFTTKVGYSRFQQLSIRSQQNICDTRDTFFVAYNFFPSYVFLAFTLLKETQSGGEGYAEKTYFSRYILIQSNLALRNFFVIAKLFTYANLFTIH